jgi:hypothetical protein
MAKIDTRIEETANTQSPEPTEGSDEPPVHKMMILIEREIY